MIGRIYGITYDLHGAVWSTVDTFGWLASATRWKQDERIMELCIRSFRLDPRWAQRAAAASEQRSHPSPGDPGNEPHRQRDYP
jgi:hypothetical protein